uniref:Uncharacterized protein n=1 Tax=Fagus sylvatica TaxID=28930 RepID=A0A2N9HEF7_FAGSY
MDLRAVSVGMGTDTWRIVVGGWWRMFLWLEVPTVGLAGRASSALSACTGCSNGRKSEFDSQFVSFSLDTVELDKVKVNSALSACTFGAVSGDFLSWLAFYGDRVDFPRIYVDLFLDAANFQQLRFRTKWPWGILPSRVALDYPLRFGVDLSKAPFGEPPKNRITWMVP